MDPRVIKSEVTQDSQVPPGLSRLSPSLADAAAAIAAVEDGRREKEEEKAREYGEISPLFLRERAEAAAAAATRTTAATAVEVEVEVEERRR